MNKRRVVLAAIILVSAACFYQTMAQDATQADATKDDTLVVVWSSGDPDVAHKVCFMYTHNAKKSKWFTDIKLVIWGPSSKLLAGDKELQEKVKAMIKDGVDVKACKACADSYGVSDDIAALGVEVKYMGRPLSTYLKNGWKTLCF
jgi:hypothetical protein